MKTSISRGVRVPILASAPFLLAVLLNIPTSAAGHPSLVTGNSFVWAEVDDSTGWITFAKGPVTNRTLGGPSYTLSHKEGSFLWVMVNGTGYTNDCEWGADVDGLLTNGRISKIGDTLQTVWHRTGFDIVQDVYPAAFLRSGQIVVRIAIVNHTGSALSARAQYLLDDEIDGVSQTSKGARSLTPYNRGLYPAYSSTDVSYPSSSNGLVPPPFFMAFTQVAKQTSFFGGTVGVGFLSDLMAPSPLGLTEPSLFAIGAASDIAGQCSWGNGIFGGESYFDEAMFIVWPTITIPATGSDASGVIAATSYGTGEYEICSGNLTAITFYPHQVEWKSGKLVPNPFTIETLIIGDTTQTGQATLSVFGSQHILTPTPVLNGGASQTQTLSPITGGALVDVKWTDSLFAASDTTLTTSLTISGMPGQAFASTCSFPILISGLPRLDSGSSFISTLYRSGSSDGSTCNARCTHAQAVDYRKCSTCGIKSVSASHMQNMTFAIEDSATGKFAVCVVDSMWDGTATVVAYEGTGETDTATYTYCTITDSLPPVIRPGFKVDTALGWAVDISEQRPWDRGLDTVIVTSLTGLRIDATRPTDMHVRGLADAWISVVPDGASQTRSICIQALDLAGNSYDTCLNFGFEDATVPAMVFPGSFKVHPNPSAGIFTIEPATAQTGYSVQVLDILGHNVAQFDRVGSFNWDAGSLPAGVYVVRLTSNEGSSQIRIIKE